MQPLHSARDDGGVWQHPEPDCWLHPDVAIGHSAIDGRGLFARARTPAGTVVSRLGGRLVTRRELDELLAGAAHQPGQPYIDTMTVTGDLHLVLPADSPNGKGNHSCDPNLWLTDAYTIALRRDVAVGEELTLDYATCTDSPDFAMPCRCGSASCRGTVTGNDWRLIELQQRYGDHWVPALREKLR